jgi:hypothetical protein
VIENAITEIDLGRQRAAFVQIFVHGIPAGEDDAGESDFIAHLQGTDFILRERSAELNHEGNRIEPQRWSSSGPQATAERGGMARCAVRRAAAYSP